MATIAFDLDYTLCRPQENAPSSWIKYGLAGPIWPNINLLNQLQDRGHKIIIYTARRMLTHDGDIDAIIEDVGALTEDWLKRHRVKYDELIFGKVYFDLLVDDKAVTPDTLHATMKLLE